MFPLRWWQDATKDVSLVDSLDMDDIELESIDTTIVSVAASALMKELTRAFFCVDSMDVGIHTHSGAFGGNVAVPTLIHFHFAPTLMLMGSSINSPEVPGVNATPSSISSASSLGSTFVGAEVGAGVVAISRYPRSCGSQKISTPHIPIGGLG